MLQEIYQAGSIQCRKYPARGNCEDRVYAVLDDSEAEFLLQGLDSQAPELITLSGFDWNRDLSPWPAEKVFERGEDFLGEGEKTLQILMEQVVPWAESEKPKTAILAGYSLAGLFALWASTKTAHFRKIGSMSGSLWYPEFQEYLRIHPPRCRSVYLSLGDRESHTKNPVMSGIAEHTGAVRLFLESQGYSCRFEWNPGNHFQKVPERMLKGILTLCEMP